MILVGDVSQLQAVENGGGLSLLVGALGYPASPNPVARAPNPVPGTPNGKPNLNPLVTSGDWTAAYASRNVLTCAYHDRAWSDALPQARWRPC